MKQLLHIEKLVFGGLGLARTDEGVILVRDVLPGEIVYATVSQEGGYSKFAVPDIIVQPSPHRRKPPCEKFGICGGCDWLFGDYAIQVSSKKEIFLECLTRIGKITPPTNYEVYSSHELGYRRRVQFKIDKARGVIGFFRRKSWEVVALHDCPLLRCSLNTLLKDTREILKILPSNSQEIKCIEGSDTTIASSPVLAQHTFASTVIRVGKYSFTVSGGHFFQNNAFLCENLETWGKEAIAGGEYFVDLYGGVGFLAILFNERFSKGTIVDNIISQVNAARRNLIDNGITHISTNSVTAEDFLSQCSHRNHRIDCLIIDPPRPGLTDLVRKRILQCLPSTIFYVSCNPSTQARDIGFLVRQAGYTCDRMALFDFYPNTHHMETAVILKR
jgi:23S rRNA (uracil1939-C5)-methyltransferase